MNIGQILSSYIRSANQMNISMREIEQSNERLSTGNKRVADHPSDTVRINRLESQVRGSQVAEKNIQDGITMIQQGESTLSTVEELGLGLRDLAVEYHNDTLNEVDKENIEKEAQAIIKEMNYMMKNTTFNGESIFSKGNVTIQTGANASETFTIKMPTFDEDFDGTNTLQSMTNTKEVKQNSLELLKNEGKAEETVNNFSQNHLNREKGESLPEEIGDKLEDFFEKMKDVFHGNHPSDKDCKPTNPDMSTQPTNPPAENNQTTPTVPPTPNPSTEKDTNKPLPSESSTEVPSNTINQDNNSNESGVWIGNVTDSVVVVINSNQDTLKDSLEDITDSIDHLTDTIKDSLEDLIESVNDMADAIKESGRQGSGSNSSVENQPIPDVSNTPIKDVLDSNFIDEHVLKPIANARASFGLSQSLLERRLDWEGNKNAINRLQLDRLQNVDMVTELRERVKNQMLLQVNTYLMHSELDQRRSMVLDLLR